MRGKSIKTPLEMQNHFNNYRKKIKSNPIIKHDFVGGAGKSVKRKIERPLTLEGFGNYLWENNILSDLKDYFSNRNEAYTDFSPICTRIRGIIRQDQIEGGMAGIYNPSITQRLNNLVEKTETEIKGSLNIPSLPDIGNRK